MTLQILTAEQAIEHATQVAVSGALEEAVKHFQQALVHFGYRADLLTNLGLTYSRLGRSDEAIHCFRNALQLDPKLKEAHLNLGLTLVAQKRYEEAGQSFQQVIALYPKEGSGHDGLGQIAHQQGYLYKAVEHYKTALDIEPTHEQSQLNLANCLLEAGNAQEGLKLLRNLAKPGCSDTILSNYLMALQYSDDVSADEILSETLKLRPPPTKRSTFKTAETLPPLQTRRPRIGLVSADLRAHPVGWFLKGIMPLLAEAFNLYIYANQNQYDYITAELKKHCLRWSNISGLSDDQACELIRQDQLDLLIDLSGYTAGHRLGLFEKRAAPRQASWLGYFGTTGLTQMDYILLDSIHGPLEHQQNFTEKIIHIEPIRMSFSPPVYAGQVGAAPFVRNGIITFGSFNNTSKINATTIDMWSRCLRRVPDSRMVIKWKTLVEPAVKINLRDMFVRHGINPSRIYFQSASAHDAMLEEYSEIDIALDTFPFTGGTTTCESLWMGVPVVTRTGDRPVSRQSSAMLNAIGLSQLSTLSAQEFEDAVDKLCADRAKLQEMRSTMRDRLMDSPLFNAAEFSKHFVATLHSLIDTPHQ